MPKNRYFIRYRVRTYGTSAFVAYLNVYLEKNRPLCKGNPLHDFFVFPIFLQGILCFPRISLKTSRFSCIRYLAEKRGFAGAVLLSSSRDGTINLLNCIYELEMGKWMQLRYLEMKLVKF